MEGAASYPKSVGVAEPTAPVQPERFCVDSAYETSPRALDEDHGRRSGSSLRYEVVAPPGSTSTVPADATSGHTCPSGRLKAQRRVYFHMRRCVPPPALPLTAMWRGRNPTRPRLR